MLIDTVVGLAIVVALIAVNAVFVAGEFALVAADRGRLSLAAQRGSRRARVAQRLAGRLAFHLSGTQLGITISSLVLGLLAEPLVGTAIEAPIRKVVGAGSAHAVSIGAALALVTVLQMVLAELVPKNVAVARPETVVMALAPVLRVYSIVFGPVISLMSGASDRFVRLLGIEPPGHLDTAVSAQELAAVIRVSSEHGAIDTDSTRLLTRSLRFANKTAADALTPRLALVTIRTDDDVDALIDAVRVSGYSRLPVITDDVDEIVGVVLAKDVLSVPPRSRSTTKVGDLMGPVLAVPETRDLESLLTALRSGEGQLAVVVDEFGSTTGIVTLEDLLEELVGAISDEYDDDELPWLATAVRGMVVLDGTARPDDVEEACGFRIPEGDFETLAGFVLSLLDHLPETGEAVEVDGYRFEVVEMDRRRIARIAVRTGSAS